MGNLGGYQAMTSLAKKVGGPKVLAGAVAIGGYAVLRQAESGLKRAWRLIQDRNAPCPTAGQTFLVTTVGENSSELTLQVGDEYRVLECDGDAILIEVIGDADNPYVVSGAFLTSISDYPASGEAEHR